MNRDQILFLSELAARMVLATVNHIEKNEGRKIETMSEHELIEAVKSIEIRDTDELIEEGERK